MASVTSRQGLIDYCLRRLGQPVVEINVDEDQLEERVDDALEYFQEYHFDGVEKVFTKHEITAGNIEDNFDLGSVFGHDSLFLGVLDARNRFYAKTHCFLPT